MTKKFEAFKQDRREDNAELKAYLRGSPTKVQYMKTQVPRIAGRSERRNLARKAKKLHDWRAAKNHIAFISKPTLKGPRLQVLVPWPLPTMLEEGKS